MTPPVPVLYGRMFEVILLYRMVKGKLSPRFGNSKGEGRREKGEAGRICSCLLPPPFCLIFFPSPSSLL
jgi:hypothetical protein